MKEFMKKFKEFSRDRKMEIISIVIIILLLTINATLNVVEMIKFKHTREEINEKCQYVQQMVQELQGR